MSDDKLKKLLARLEGGLKLEFLLQVFGTVEIFETVLAKTPFWTWGSWSLEHKSGIITSSHSNPVIFKKAMILFLHKFLIICYSVSSCFLHLRFHNEVEVVSSASVRHYPWALGLLCCLVCLLPYHVIVGILRWFIVIKMARFFCIFPAEWTWKWNYKHWPWHTFMLISFGSFFYLLFVCFFFLRM